MTARDFSTITPEALFEDFTQIRQHLSKTDEAAHAARVDTDRALAWQERRPKDLDRRAFEALGLTIEDLERQAREEGEAYDAFRAAHQVAPPQARADPTFGLHPMPLPGTTAAFPYAVVKAGPDMAALESFDAEGTGNPDAYKLGDFHARQSIFLELRLTGSGLYDFSFLPEYLTTKSASVYWYFLHVPDGQRDWHCTARPWFHGAYSVWADDAWYNSKFARVAAAASVHLVPFGHHHSTQDPWQTQTKVVFQEGGENVNTHRPDDWLPEFALSPYAAYRNVAHWIIVSASAFVDARGQSHAQVDFKRYWTPGPRTKTKYGIYCHGVKIHGG